MNILMILLLVILILIALDIHSMVRSILGIVDNIYKNTIKEPKYDEHSAITFNKYTSFRVAPFTRSDGKVVYDVQYRNPSDTAWKVCRVEYTFDEAENEMEKIINDIKVKNNL